MIFVFKPEPVLVVQRLPDPRPTRAIPVMEYMSSRRADVPKFKVEEATMDELKQFQSSRADRARRTRLALPMPPNQLIHHDVHPQDDNLLPMRTIHTASRVDGGGPDLLDQKTLESLQEVPPPQSITPHDLRAQEEERAHVRYLDPICTPLPSF